MDSFHFLNSGVSEGELPQPKRDPYPGWRQQDAPDLAVIPEQEAKFAAQYTAPRFTRPANAFLLRAGLPVINPGGNEHRALGVNGTNTGLLKIPANLVHVAGGRVPLNVSAP